MSHTKKFSLVTSPQNNYLSNKFFENYFYQDCRLKQKTVVVNVWEIDIKKSVTDRITNWLLLVNIVKERV